MVVGWCGGGGGGQKRAFQAPVPPPVARCVGWCVLCWWLCTKVPSECLLWAAARCSRCSFHCVLAAATCPRCCCPAPATAPQLFFLALTSAISIRTRAQCSPCCRTSSSTMFCSVTTCSRCCMLCPCCPCCRNCPCDLPAPHPLLLWSIALHLRHPLYPGHPGICLVWHLPPPSPPPPFAPQPPRCNATSAQVLPVAFGLTSHHPLSLPPCNSICADPIRVALSVEPTTICSATCRPRKPLSSQTRTNLTSLHDQPKLQSYCCVCCRDEKTKLLKVHPALSFTTRAASEPNPNLRVDQSIEDRNPLSTMLTSCSHQSDPKARPQPLSSCFTRFVLNHGT